MAETYIEVSTKFVMPGVDRVEMLSLPQAKNISKGERAAKVAEVGALAKSAKQEVKKAANSVSGVN